MVSPTTPVAPMVEWNKHINPWNCNKMRKCVLAFPLPVPARRKCTPPVLRAEVGDKPFASLQSKSSTLHAVDHSLKVSGRHSYEEKQGRHRAETLLRDPTWRISASTHFEDVENLVVLLVVRAPTAKHGACLAVTICALRVP